MWDDNIIGELKEVDYEGDWKILCSGWVTWRSYVLAAMNLRVHNASELVKNKNFFQCAELYIAFQHHKLFAMLIRPRPIQ